MRAGTLRHPITIEQATETQESTYGSVSEAWATYQDVRARKATTGGKEFYAASRINDQLDVLYVTWFVSGVTQKMRVNDGGTYYDILAAYDPTGHGRELHLVCKLVE